LYSGGEVGLRSAVQLAHATYLRGVKELYENPDHIDMLRYVCEQRQWDGDALRGYRCRIEYPVYSSEIVMAFDLPVGSEGPA